MKKTLALVSWEIPASNVCNADIYVANARIVKLLGTDVDFKRVILHFH